MDFLQYEVYEVVILLGSEHFKVAHSNGQVPMRAVHHRAIIMTMKMDALQG